MPTQLLISHTPQNPHQISPTVALLKGDRLCRLFSDSPLGQAGDIYLAKVVRVLPSLSLAFLDIGEPKNAVLSIPKDIPIRLGQTLTVMSTRPALADKGAIATTAISLSSPYVVYKPQGVGVGVSAKIPKPLTHSLKQTAQNIIAELSLVGGVVVRTSAQLLENDDDLKNHIAHLHATYQDICKNPTKNPTRLYRPPLALSIFCHDIDLMQIDEILTDDGAIYDDWRGTMGRLLPHLADKIHLRPVHLFDTHHVHDELHRALSPKVALPSGAYLMIDECEAMTVIDVNTGSLVNSSQDVIYQANLEASKQIAFELMLRQIGGLVVIDFIDMKNVKNQQSIYENLQKYLANDTAKIRLLPFNEFGLIQLSRERKLLSLSHIYSQTCPTCQGKGRTNQGVNVLAIVAKLTTLAHQELSPKDDIVLRVSDSLAKILLNSTDFIKIKSVLQEQLSLKIITEYPDDKYDILLNQFKKLK